MEELAFRGKRVGLLTLGSTLIFLSKIDISKTRCISIRSFILTKKHFQSLVSCCYNCTELRLPNCKLEDTEDIKFRDDLPYKLSIIGLERTGASHNSNWVSNFSKFSGILRAISNCGLGESLKRINLRHCEFGQMQVLSELENYGLRHIRLNL
mmetsp:Transcript_29910/g.26462  ORF Transcript_29910/g.26462 Transcript_29910/m.26462 type:complete len:153 (-) Transcript_29910:23-481(-)